MRSIRHLTFFLGAEWPKGSALLRFLFLAAVSLAGLACGCVGSPDTATPGVGGSSAGLYEIDGSVRPLVWLHEYRSNYTHAFWFAQALALPAGTTIRGVPVDARVLLIPAREQ